LSSVPSSSATLAMTVRTLAGSSVTRRARAPCWRSTASTLTDSPMRADSASLSASTSTLRGGALTPF
jgi:hypothetical protein